MSNEETNNTAAQETKAYHANEMAGSGSLGYGLDKPCRPSLMERVSSQRRRAQQEADQVNRLAELQYLLEKNPEVARILDLLELVKG